MAEITLHNEDYQKERAKHEQMLTKETVGVVSDVFGMSKSSKWRTLNLLGSIVIDDGNSNKENRVGITKMSFRI